MRYRVVAHYEFERDTQEWYDELVEEGYFPDEAKREIEDRLLEDIRRIGTRAANVIYGHYDEEYKVEELDD